MRLTFSTRLLQENQGDTSSTSRDVLVAFDEVYNSNRKECVQRGCKNIENRM